MTPTPTPRAARSSGPRAAAPTRSRAEGFTLVELLIVVAIVGVLAWAFLPDLIGGQEAGLRAASEARMAEIAAAADAYERARKNYPPDDFRDPGLDIKAKADNGTNTGIESLVAYTQSVQGINRFEGEDMLANTDGDQNGSLIQYLDRSDRPEVVDAWGTPYAYFSAWNGGFEREQRITTPGGIEITAKAWKTADGRYVGGRKYQIVSAGADLVFNTDDDLTHPSRR